MISLAALAVFSGLSLNLLLQFALGIGGAAGGFPQQKKKELPLGQLCILFLSVVLLWLVFSFIFPPHWRGFSEYFLYFPFSALVCMGMELAYDRVVPRIWGRSANLRKVYSAITAYEGLVPIALLLTLALSVNFAGAVMLALFFSLGNLTAILILNEIRRRSTLELTPRHLRGSPLILVSMGLLSLIFGAAAGICFRILEVF